jgi:hypothetical protein
MTKPEILAELERQQAIQGRHYWKTPEWQEASRQIHLLAEMLTGKKPQDACGRAK